jgi:hypothetical protein
MAFKDSLRTLLQGGLPALLDYGDAAGNTQGDQTRVESTAPEPTNRDLIPGLNLMTITQNQILMLTGGILAVLGIIYLVRK